ncbi:hypothetical protein [Streptomyces sp. NPDC002159]
MCRYANSTAGDHYFSDELTVDWEAAAGLSPELDEYAVEQASRIPSAMTVTRIKPEVAKAGLRKARSPRVLS